MNTFENSSLGPAILWLQDGGVVGEEEGGGRGDGRGYSWMVANNILFARRPNFSAGGESQLGDGKQASYSPIFFLSHDSLSFWKSAISSGLKWNVHKYGIWKQGANAQCSPCKIQIILEKATVTQTGKWEMDLLCKYERRHNRRDWCRFWIKIVIHVSKKPQYTFPKRAMIQRDL